ncbi:MAG: DUF4330 family protein [Clostridia bacterium]|nr:DUF4330 family protein [Clostridia bacterium]
MKKTLSRTDRLAVFCIDIVCVLLPLALLVCFFFAARPRLGRQNNTPLLYTVTLSAVRDEYVHGISLQAPVLDAVSKRPIGELVSCEIRPAVTQSYSKRAGCMKPVAYPGYQTVTMTIRAEGVSVSGGYSLGGFTLYRGERISLRLPNFVGTGVCTSLQVEAS